MTIANPSTAQARTLVDELARGGLTDVVLCPGSRSAPLAFAFDADPRVRVHVHLDERSAAFVALGLAIASGRPAAVVVTSGSAVANLFPAVLEADAAGVALVLLTADRPPELRDTGADQTVHQPGLFAGTVRWAVDLGIAEDRPDAVATWRASAARALATARGLAGPPGPVHVNVPFREPTVPAVDDGRVAAAPFLTPLEARPGPGVGVPTITVTSPLPQLDQVRIDALAARFGLVERGVLLVGSGAQDARIAAAVHALAAVTGWPVLAEGHVAARHRDGALQSWMHLLEQDSFRSAHRPDLVVRVGRTTLTRAIGAWLAHAGEIVIDAHGRWWDPGHRMRELIAADPVDTLTRIATSIGVDTGSAWGDAWRDADAAVVAALDHLLASGGGLDGARTVRAAVAAAPAGAHVVVASSLAVRHLDRHGPVRSDVTWHANRGVAGIDGTVSTAHGVALAAQAPVIAVLGDVALLHDTNGWLLDAGDEEPDLVVVALDDDGGGIFDLLPPGDYPAQRRLFATPHGRDLTRLATLHGVTAHTAAPEDVAKVVEAACARGGRHLVVVDVAPPDPAVAQTVREVVARTLSVLGDVARAP